MQEAHVHIPHPEGAFSPLVRTPTHNLSTEVMEGQKGQNCRQVTPHLGYLTNWHSHIKSVKNSLSNTLSEGPGHQSGLCGKIKKKQKHDQSSPTCFFLPYLPACSRSRAPIFSFSFFFFVSTTEELLSSRSDDRVSGWSVWPLSHGAAKRKSKQEDNCEVSAQEICGNKVSTCHSCETLLKAHSARDNRFQRYTQGILYFGGLFLQSSCRSVCLGLCQLLYYVFKYF